MAAGPGPGGGAWPATGSGSQGPSGYQGPGVPPLADWKHLTVQEQFKRHNEWRRQHKQAQRTATAYASQPQPQPRSQAPQSQETQPAPPRVSHPLPPRPVAPPAIDRRRNQVEPGRKEAGRPIPPWRRRNEADRPIPPWRRRNEADRPPPPWRRQTRDHTAANVAAHATAHHATAHPAALNLAATNTLRNLAPAQAPRNEVAHVYDRSHLVLPEGYELVNPTAVTCGFVTPQPAPSSGVQAHASRPNRFQPAASHAAYATPVAPPAFQSFSTPNPVAQWDYTAAIESSSVNPQPADAASAALPALQTLSITDPVADSGPTEAINTSPVCPHAAATAATEHHVTEVHFPHLEDLEFQPLTRPVKVPDSNEGQASQDAETASSKTAKNRAKRAKQKIRFRAKKQAAAAAAAEGAAGATPEVAVVSDETPASGPVNESPASPQEASGPLSKNQAKKARQKAKKAAAAAAEAEENDLLDKMKEDSKFPRSPGGERVRTASSQYAAGSGTGALICRA